MNMNLSVNRILQLQKIPSLATIGHVNNISNISNLSLKVRLAEQPCSHKSTHLSNFVFLSYGSPR